MDKKYYTEIDWDKMQKWDEVKIPRSELGFDDDGINVIKREAKKCGCIVDIFKYEDCVKFVVYEKKRSAITQEEKAKKVYELIKEFGDGCSVSYLRSHTGLLHKNLTTILNALLEQEHIFMEVKSEGRGRPSKTYYPNIDNPFTSDDE